MANEKGLGGKAMRLLFAAAVMSAGHVCGATRVWTGGSGNWTDTANWLDNLTPSGRRQRFFDKHPVRVAGVVPGR